MRCEPRLDYGRAIHAVERRSDSEVLPRGGAGGRARRTRAACASSTSSAASLEPFWNPRTCEAPTSLDSEVLENGGGGNRTPVRRRIHESVYVRSPRFNVAALAPTGGISCGQPAKSRPP